MDSEFVELFRSFRASARALRWRTAAARAVRCRSPSSSMPASSITLAALHMHELGMVVGR